VFVDVPPDHWARPAIEILGRAGITSGCGEHRFCPDSLVTRAEMAVFLLRARHGFEFAPPAARGIFADVPPSHWAAAWIEQMAEENLGAGCGVGLYCPEAVMTRAQMAVSLVRALSIPGTLPPAASGVFGDVPATHWAAAWIEELARVRITAGCGAGQYCPESSVTRAQMAVFLVTAFGLGP
jgi:hypothetical protein